MPALFTRLRRRCRRLFGHGWDARDFSQRYRDAGEDAWGYENSAAHALRHDRILAAIPHDRPFRQGFEAGCAEGHLTGRLADRIERLLACDLNDEAVRRTQKRLGEREQVTVSTLDLRKGIPLDEVDLLVFSDVLYYLRPREVAGIVRAIEKITSPGAILLFANEWSPRCHGMTSPDTVIALIEASGCWQVNSRVEFPTGSDSRHTVAVFNRLPKNQPLS